MLFWLYHYHHHHYSPYYSTSTRLVLYCYILLLVQNVRRRLRPPNHPLLLCPPASTSNPHLALCCPVRSGLCRRAAFRASGSGELSGKEYDPQIMTGCASSANYSFLGRTRRATSMLVK